MENTFYLQSLFVDSFGLPKTFDELFYCLKFKPDKTGLSEFKNKKVIPEEGEESEFNSVIVGFDINLSKLSTFRILDLCDHRSMSKTKAVRFLIQYLFVHDIVEELALSGDFSCWIPFNDEDESGSFRIFVRKNGTKELFLYSSKDISNWSTADTFVALSTFL